ncbi:MAG: hypothetical protein DI630_00865 [Gordonia sp. (in: high G+C Gram-positive bacteria)]|nr:MAG: hypothetical protein DI630_00865 [Gordonia sp. (in: high G+C Gram-positive bacteria)]
MRLQIPSNDPDIDAFLTAQGPRFQSQAILMLIRMWINEFGPVNVLDRTMDAVTVTGLKQNSLSARASGSSAPSDTDVPAQTSPAASAAEPEVETPQPSTSKKKKSSTPEPPAAGEDFEAYFRQQ